MAERPVKVNLKPFDDEAVAWMWASLAEASASAAEYATRLVYRRRRPWYRRRF